MTRFTDLTIQGRLEYGIEIDGVLHADFELRLPTVADNVAVFAEQPEASSLQADTALLQRCLTRLSDIPAETLAEPGWLEARLIEDDYDVLRSTMGELKKKRKAANAASAASEPQS